MSSKKKKVLENQLPANEMPIVRTPSMFDKLLFRFALVYEKGENYDEAIEKFKPQVIKTKERDILFLETNKKLMRDKGVTIPSEFANYARFVVLMPNPDFGCCIQNRQMVEFPAFVDNNKSYKFMPPVEHDEESLIGDYFILTPKIDDDVEVYFLTIIASKVDEIISISVNQEVWECICETCNEEDDLINYSIRTPTIENLRLQKTKQFDDYVKKLFKNINS